MRGCSESKLDTGIFSIGHALQTALHFLYPRNCALCGTHVPPDSTHPLKNTSGDLCPDCRLPDTAKLPFWKQQCLGPSLEPKGTSDLCFCRHCSEPIPGYLEICVPCSIFPPDTQHLWSLFSYQPNLERLIKTFKYYDRHKLGKYLGQMMGEAALELSQETHDWDLLLPIPSSPSVQKQRGYSHSALITKAMSKKLRIPWDGLALRSVGDRKPQAGLALELRINNTEKAFCAHSDRVKNKRILLVDDVLTSGATISAAGAALLRAGAAEVDAITLARSLRFQKNRIKTTVANNKKRIHC